ncbi:MAG: hypothetical protein H6932_05220 [Burkholderiaceae bacterium]|nr:hypothetical protein [Burkholderiaceae bacterium]
MKRVGSWIPSVAPVCAVSAGAVERPAARTYFLERLVVGPARQHSPRPFRVRGPMAQMPAFAAAFACRPGDPMAAADPVAVW